MMATPVFKDLDAAYVAVLGDVLDNGFESAPRGMRTKELLHVSFTLADAGLNILVNAERKPARVFSVAEFLWILLGRRDVASIAYFNGNIEKFSDDGVHFYGAYGPWVAAQLPYVIDALRRDADTRQAVMTIWRQSPPRTRDVPCTVALQFLLRAGRLHAQAFMRSNDAWLGLPYDVFNFTALQSYVATAVGVEPGLYTHTVGSLHLYERDFVGAGLARRTAFWSRRSPPMAALPDGVDLSALFTAVADRESAWTAPVEGLPEPWRTYMGLLKWKTTRDRSLLRPPYDELITRGA